MIIAYHRFMCRFWYWLWTWYEDFYMEQLEGRLYGMRWDKYAVNFEDYLKRMYHYHDMELFADYIDHHWDSR